MNDKTKNGNTDAGISDIECRPGMQKRGNMPTEIEKKEIDHVPVKQAISQIAEHAREQKRE